MLTPCLSGVYALKNLFSFKIGAINAKRVLKMVAEMVVFQLTISKICVGFIKQSKKQMVLSFAA